MCQPIRSGRPTPHSWNAVYQGCERSPVISESAQKIFWISFQGLLFSLHSSVLFLALAEVRIVQLAWILLIYGRFTPLLQLVGGFRASRQFQVLGGIAPSWAGCLNIYWEHLESGRFVSGL